MPNKTVTGFGIGLLIIFAGLFISQQNPTFGLDEPMYIILIAFLTTIVFIYTINKFIKSENDEIFISGFLLGGIELYVFMIQPNVPYFPHIAGNAELYFGSVGIVRILMLLVQKFGVKNKFINTVLGR